ncbi:MAG TPA: hypothetical protein VIA11_09655 [Acidimicrobiia bacterium]|nr:hypothetical protein [Acidimicrobiia bacterium]
MNDDAEPAEQEPEEQRPPDEPDGAAASDAAEPGEVWERPIDRFRRGAAGSVIAAGLLGVRDALEGRPEKEEPAIVSEAPEPRLDHIDLVLDPEHPERSRAVVYLPPPEERDDDA